MEKKMNKKALLISLVLTLVACGLIYNYINKMEKPQQEVPKTKMLVAIRNISVGEEIKASDINSIDVSIDSIMSGIINDRKSIEGFYAKDEILIGEPFRQERLALKDELMLSFNIPDGMRAISVFVSENTIFSNQLRVGDKVDVIGNFKTETSDGKSIASSKTIIQDVEVLAIGSNRISKNDTDQADAADESKLPKTVTLSVTPGDAEKVSFTTAFGEYTLTLRGHTDNKKVNTPGTIIQHVTPY